MQKLGQQLKFAEPNLHFISSAVLPVFDLKHRYEEIFSFSDNSCRFDQIYFLTNQIQLGELVQLEHFCSFLLTCFYNTNVKDLTVIMSSYVIYCNIELLIKSINLYL